jgi:two-component sensor histidine kinase
MPSDVPDGQTGDEVDPSASDKLALLREVDHRVKNNLQLISSLVLLQCRRAEDEAVQGALKGVLDRVNAVATVHRRLFQREDIERFDLSQFVRDLANDLAVASRRPEVTFRLDLDPTEVAASQAAPAALVINELVGNALKHAFPEDRAGVIDIRIRRSPQGFDLMVQDDGVGLRGAEEEIRGFGLTIANLLCRQLRATLTLAAAQPGVQATVRLESQPGRP